MIVQVFGSEGEGVVLPLVFHLHAEEIYLLL